MIVSSSKINRYFKQLFSHTLTESVRKRLAGQVEIIIPEPGEPFWNSKSSPPGIYIVLEGKVRLVDEQDNLLVSLSEGMVLGQISLFAKQDLKHHAARASLNAKLGYLSHKSLYKYLLPKSKFESYLYSQALKWDLLIGCSPDTENRDSQDTTRDRRSLQEILSILPDLQYHSLAEGELPPKVLESSLLLMRQGRILHSSGLQLVPGRQYYPDSLPKDGVWSNRSLGRTVYLTPRTPTRVR